MSLPYSTFAAYYDYLMRDVNYDEWAERIVIQIKTHHPKARILVDLACGTGNITGRLAKKGFATFGIDLSEQMLMIAQDKAHDQHLRVQYLKQDMTNFRVHKKPDVITAICDGLNYLVKEGQAKAFFDNANRQLNPEGILILDLSSEYKYKYLLADKTIAELDEEVSFIWENSYDEVKKELSFDIAFFVKDQVTGQYRREMEHHVQKAYSVSELLELAELHFECLAVLDGLTGEAFKEDSERLMIVLKKR